MRLHRFASLNFLLLVVKMTSSTQTASSPSKCEDSPTFRSKFGIPCSEHENIRCEALQVLGWSPAEVDDLLLNCPLSCAVPACIPGRSPTAAPTLNIKASTVLDLLQGRGLTATTTAVVTSSSRLLRSRQMPVACYPGWPTSCQDDPTYLFQTNVGCDAFQVFESCLVAKDVISLTDIEYLQLTNRCPCTCDMQCTAAPTPAPVPTQAPVTTPPVGPRFNPVAAAAAAMKRGSQLGGSPDTFMTIILSVGGAVGFFVCAFATIFAINRRGNNQNEETGEESTEDMHRHRKGSGDDDDHSETSDLSDEFYEDERTERTERTSRKKGHKKERKKKKKSKGESPACLGIFQMPDIELCI